jgi:hypothetical protein
VIAGQQARTCRCALGLEGAARSQTVVRPCRLKYKFAPNWSVFVEYNHAEFGELTPNFGDERGQAAAI